jgi:hypothetical protein
MIEPMSNYENTDKEKTADEILSSAGCDVSGALGEYLRVAAQVRTSQELAADLRRASADSGKLQRRVMILTVVLVAASIVQAVATAWAHLAWWWNNGFRLH